MTQQVSVFCGYPKNKVKGGKSPTCRNLKDVCPYHKMDNNGVWIVNQRGGFPRQRCEIITSKLERCTMDKQRCPYHSGKNPEDYIYIDDSDRMFYLRIPFKNLLKMRDFNDKIAYKNYIPEYYHKVLHWEKFRKVLKQIDCK